MWILRGRSSVSENGERLTRASTWCLIALLCSLHLGVQCLPLRRRSTVPAFTGFAQRRSLSTPGRPRWLVKHLFLDSRTPASRLSFPLGALMDSAEDEDDSNDGGVQGGGERLRTNFNSLFRGMPGMDEILGDGPAGTNPPPNQDPPIVKEKWMKQKRIELEQRYATLLEEAMVELDQQRREDPSSVPDNFYTMLETVLKEELEAEWNKAQEQRSKELLEDMESKKLEELENMDFTDAEDDTVRKIIEEADSEADRLDVVQTKMESYSQYEKEAMRLANESPVDLPNDDADMDEWALERMQEMLSKSQGNATSAIPEHLENSIQELRSRLENKKDQSPIQPETMKDWQMYRAIATRLAKEQDDSVTETVSTRNATEDEAAIASQLESWKEFQRKEEDYRRRSGLASSRVKMPFDWQEPGKDPMDELKSPEPIAEDNRTSSEIRMDINRQALEAMEKLLSQGTIRSERIEKKIEALKKELESPETPTEERIEPEEKIEKIDLSDVFGSQSSKRRFSRRAPHAMEDSDVITSPEASDMEDYDPVEDDGLDSEEPPQPPDTPFFSSEADEDIPSWTDSESTEQKAQPPDTPFFSADDDDENFPTWKDSAEEGETKLGSLQEQKLRSMYQRAGARTETEQEELRKQWEEFQKYEQKTRDMSGLSDSSDALNETSMLYNISDVTKGDGDFDAEKVLASIGPRPTRKKRKLTVTDEASSGPSQRQKSAQSDRELPADDTEQNTQTPITDEGRTNVRSVDVKSSDRSLEVERGSDIEDESDQVEDTISDELAPDRFSKGEGSTDARDRPSRLEEEYGQRQGRRQMGIDISDIVGRGGYKDYSDYEPETVRRNWGKGSSFTARKASLLDNTELDIRAVNALMEHKDSPYTTGVSQYMKKINRPFWAFGVVFRLEGTLVDITGLQYQAWIKVADRYGFPYPDLDDVRRAAVARTEIAVRKIFFWSDDLLLSRDVAATHREIFRDVFCKWMEVQNIISRTPEEDIVIPEADYRDGTTGTSMSTGGVAIDSPVSPTNEKSMLELEYKAWTRTANECGFEEPYPEFAMAAMVINDPYVLVRDGFAWTDDPSEIKRLVKIFERSKSELLEDLYGTGQSPLKKMGKTSADVNPRQDMTTTTGEKPLPVANEKSMLEIEYKAWRRTAEECGFEEPYEEEAMAAMVINDPYVLVRDGFAWADDPSEIKRLVDVFERAKSEILMETYGAPETSIVKGSSGNDNGGDVSEPENAEDSASSTPFAPLNEKSKLEVEYKAWKRTADECGFEEPYEEEVMAAMAIDDPYVLVRDGFGWAEEPSETKRLVDIYEKAKTELLMEIYGAPEKPTVDSLEKDSEGEASISEGTEDSVPQLSEKSKLEVEYKAWKRTADECGFEEPYEEEVMAAMAIDDPFVLVRDGFGWAEEPSEIKRLVDIYEEARSDLLAELYGVKSIPQPETKESLGTQLGPTEQEIVEMNVFSWTVTAKKHGYKPPRLVEIRLAMDRSAADAIRNIFRWADDEEAVTQISATQREARQKISAKIMEKYNLSEESLLANMSTSDDGVDSISATKEEIFHVTLDAWTTVADHYKFSTPENDDILYAMTVDAENAIVDGFKWTNDPGKVKEIAKMFGDALERSASKLIRTYKKMDLTPKMPRAVDMEQKYPLLTVTPDAAKWVQSLLDMEIPCAVVSYLEGDQVNTLLEQAGLAHLFPPGQRVSMSNGYGLESQQLLGAAVRLERRPDHCVFFDTTPESAAIAHDVEMKCVGITGIYPRYDLLSSDSTARYFSDFSVMNIRSLFGEGVDDEPMLDMKDTQPTKRPPIRTKFWEEGDRS